MNLIKIILLVSLVLVTNNTKAKESVIIDFSALDNLSSSPVIKNQPLFPVVEAKKTTSVSNKAKTLGNTKKSKKSQVQKANYNNQVKVKNTKDKSKLSKVDNIKVESLSHAKKDIELPSKSDNASKAEEVIAVDSSIQEKLEVNHAKKSSNINSNTSNSSENSNNELSDNTQREYNKDSKRQTDSKENAIEQGVKKISKAESLSEDNLPKKEVSSVVTKVVPSIIYFAKEESNLLPEQEKQIDAIISSFQNIEENKIGIYSYNLDNGIDSFKKKRVSLNRAIAVRTYLLKQGYKNFSIKVININSDSDRLNSVEIKEI